MNLHALQKYQEAKILGNKHRKKAIQKVRDGIACFDTLDEALNDAKENIKRYSTNDFTEAHFYEVVKAEVLKLINSVRVVLDGEALVFRVKENGVYADRVFIRDHSEPISNNIWIQVGSYGEFVRKYESHQEKHRMDK